VNNMFGWLKGFGGKDTHRRTLRTLHAPVRVRGRYDAAATTEENRRHWANADMLSAAAANNPQVRRTLRSRARYEVANIRLPAEPWGLSIPRMGLRWPSPIGPGSDSSSASRSMNAERPRPRSWAALDIPTQPWTNMRRTP
jgi:hypothetical protein